MRSKTRRFDYLDRFRRCWRV